MRGFLFANWRKTAPPVPEMVVDKSLEDTPEAFPLRLMKEVAEMSSHRRLHLQLLSEKICSPNFPHQTSQERTRSQAC
jgi:hypothetical protein